LSQQRGITVEYRKVPGASHFYEDELDALRDIVAGHVEAALERLVA
jgi:alpha/beta superfamily hydrolase